jgi:hypothetical protein
MIQDGLDSSREFGVNFFLAELEMWPRPLPEGVQAREHTGNEFEVLSIS